MWFGTSWFYPNPSGLPQCHCGNHMIASVPLKHCWRIWVNASLEWIKNWSYNHNKTQQNKTMCIWHISWDIWHKNYSVKHRDALSIHSPHTLCLLISPWCCVYMPQWTGSTLVQIMACRLFGAKPLSKLMLGYCRLHPQEQNSVKFELKYKSFHSRKCMQIYRLRNCRHFVQGEMS